MSTPGVPHLHPYPCRAARAPAKCSARCRRCRCRRRRRRRPRRHRRPRAPARLRRRRPRAPCARCRRRGMRRPAGACRRPRRPRRATAAATRTARHCATVSCAPGPRSDDRRRGRVALGRRSVASRHAPAMSVKLNGRTQTPSTAALANQLPSASGPLLSAEQQARSDTGTAAHAQRACGLSAAPWCRPRNNLTWYQEAGARTGSAGRPCCTTAAAGCPAARSPTHPCGDMAPRVSAALHTLAHCRLRCCCTPACLHSEARAPGTGCCRACNIASHRAALLHSGVEAGMMPARASQQPWSGCTSASEQLWADVMLGTLG
jgi:hypothetical protein